MWFYDLIKSMVYLLLNKPPSCHGVVKSPLRNIEAKNVQPVTFGTLVFFFPSLLQNVKFSFLQTFLCTLLDSKQNFAEQKCKCQHFLFFSSHCSSIFCMREIDGSSTIVTFPSSTLESIGRPSLFSRLQYKTPSYSELIDSWSSGSCFA